MKNNLPAKQSNFLLYTGKDGKINVEVFLKDETVWLTQKAMSELFGVNIPAISKHLSNIFESGELQKEATISILETVQKEGNRQVKRKMEFYNLDVIISVGYRVNSYQARITLMNCWSASGKSGPVSDAFIKKLPTYIPSRQIMTKMRLLPKSFLQQYKTSCIGL
jgi:hypothetical protein